VRRALREDQEVVLELCRRYLTSATSSYGVLLTFNAEVLASLIDYTLEHGIIYLGEVGGLPVGFIAGLVGPNAISGERMAEEFAWWVNEEHRGGRLAYYLLRSFEEWAGQNGSVCLKMVAPAGSAVGVFYERLGFTPLETAYIKRLRQDGTSALGL
jgi:GNAT superfamily N-acetyltransferase